MRKIDVIANERFNGNTIETLKDILDSGGKLGEYREELNEEELAYVMRYVTEKVAIEKYGSQEKFNKAIEIELKLKSLNLTEEEVKNAQKNPYKSEISKSFLKLLITEGVVIALSLVSASLGVGEGALVTIGSTLTAIMSYGVAENIIKYVKFKKIKKDIDNNLLNSSSDKIDRG